MLTLVREQVKLVLERYKSDFDANKGNKNINDILKNLQSLSRDPANAAINDANVYIINLAYNARKYVEAHDKWYRKRWGSSNRLFKLAKNLLSFGNFYQEKYKKIAGVNSSHVEEQENESFFEKYSIISIGENLDIAKQVKDRRDALRKQRESENEINTNSSNIIEDPEPILLNENTKKTSKKKKTEKKYNVNKDSYAILYALRDDALQARSSGNNSPQYGAFLQIFNDLQLTAFDIYHKNGNKEELLKLYARQVHDLKIAAKAYVDYKYSYRTEDQTKEPGKDKLNKQDRKKLKVVKRVLKYSFSSKVPKLITIDDKKENVQEHEPELINIRVNEEDNIIADDKQEGAAYEAMTMTYEQNVLGDKISRKEFEENGGTVKHRYVTEAESKKIVEDTHGFLAAKKVAGKNGIVELVPSLPEYTTIYKGQKNEKRVPLRKTIKTMFKTMAHLLVDKKGHIKKNIDKYNGKSIEVWLDDLLVIEPDEIDMNKDLQEFIKDIVKPEMENILQKDYKAKAVKNYKAKASDDANAVCNNYLELVKASESPFKKFTSDDNFENFIKRNTFIKTVKASDIMKHKSFKQITIDGRPLTKDEVETALKEFREEVDANVADFAQIKNIDTDSVEAPGFGSGDDNAGFKTLLMGKLVAQNEAHYKIEHKFKDIDKKNPEKSLDIIMKNMDNIIEASPYYANNAQEMKAQLTAIDKKKQSGPLDEKDIQIIKDIYQYCSKNEWHIAANLGNSGNVLYTEETFNAMSNQLQKAPITNNIMTGIYRSDKPMQMDKEDPMLHHSSFSSYYGHSGTFAHCHDHNSVVRAKLRNLLYKMSGTLV